MTPAQQDARTARKLETSRLQATQIQSAFNPGTAEHCLAGAVIQAVGMAEERVGLQKHKVAAQPVRRVVGAGRWG